MDDKVNLATSFAYTITELDNRLPKSMTECERFGMTWGCKEHCPVFERGECEIQKENERIFNQRKSFSL